MIVLFLLIFPISYKLFSTLSLGTKPDYIQQ